MRHFQSRPASDFRFEEILYQKKGRVATVILNRPGIYNCLSTLTLEEVTSAFRDIADDDAIGVAVLTGAGERAFCTGGDV